MESIAIVNCCLPPPPEKPLGAPQAGLYLTSALKNSKRETSIYDTAADFEPNTFTADALCAYLRRVPHRVIGLSIWDSVLPRVLCATRKLKEKEPERIIVFGGPSASSLNTKLLDLFPWIDAVVVGEGEITLDMLLTSIDSRRSNALDLPEKAFLRSNGRVLEGKRKIPTLSPRQIPIPDYSHINRSVYGRLELVTTRGCPLNCAYCSVNSATGRLMRSRPMDHLFQEIAALVKDEQDCIHVLDDNFTINAGRLHQFSSRFFAEFPKNTWSCYARLGDLDGATTSMMIKSGCCGVFIGVESADEVTLRSVGKISPNYNVLERIKKISTQMNITVSLIWGFPDEEVEALARTLDFIKQLLDFDNIFVNLYQLAPLSGTRLTHRMMKDLIFDEAAISGFVFPPSYPTLSDDEKKMIRRYPSVFSAFYHEGSKLFRMKHSLVQKFLGN